VIPLNSLQPNAKRTIPDPVQSSSRSAYEIKALEGSLVGWSAVTVTHLKRLCQTLSNQGEPDSC